MKATLCSRFTIVLALLLLIMLPILLLFIQPQGYSYNLYSQVPTNLWIMIIFGMIFSICPLLMDWPLRKSHRYLVIVILLIFYVMLLTIPHLLGYIVINRTDDMYILGEIKTIIGTGHFYEEYDKYPLVSILYSSLFIITGLNGAKYVILMPIVFSVLYVFSLWSIFKEAYTGNQKYLTLGVPLSFIYYASFYHDSVHPAWYSFTLSVILIYLIISNRFLKSSSGKLLIATVLVSLPFSHPYYVTTSLMFLGALFIYEAVLRKASRAYFKTYLNYMTLTLIVFLLWILHNFAASYAFSNIIIAIKNAYLKPVITEGLSKTMALTRNELIIFTLGYLGRFSILAILSSVMVLIVLIRGSIKDVILSKVKMWYIILTLITIQFTLLFAPLFGHYPERHLNVSYLSIVFPLGVLLLLSHFTSTQKKLEKMIVKTIMPLLVSITLLTSIFSVYIHPEISFRPNSGITSNEIAGTAFIFNHRQKEIFIFSPYDQIVERYCEFANLPSYKECKYNNIRYLYQKILPDKHLGYTEYNRFTLLVPVSNVYILLSDCALQTYSYIPPYKRAERLSMEDYFRMNSDRDLERIYSGLNIRIYLYRGK